MIANYHTHTARCRHASGTEEEYVENACAQGLKIFGFSDHTPQFFPGDYYSHMRMFPEDFPQYCQKVRALQEQYKGKLEIPLGLEVEYYPSIFKELLLRLQDAGIEYMLLGQHWVGDEENEPYAGRPSQDESLLKRHCQQTINALETGLFTYLAHPDLFHFVGDSKIYLHHIRQVCAAARDTGTPLEINLLGLREHRHYPNPLLWEAAALEGCQTVLGMDAHAPWQVLDTDTQSAALALADTYGLNVLGTVTLKKI